MNLPDSKISEFIHEHHVLTLATCVDNQPWCCNCFYAYLDDEQAFVFTSDDATRHVQNALVNESVAGTVVLETKTVGKIQGLQFSGKMYRPEGELKKKALRMYLKKFPYAALMNTSLWVLVPNYLKLTDNRLGFGKKLHWYREQ